MCRRIITHRMHHDVATPMLIHTTRPDAVAYANPLRTSFHRCELALPPVGWLLDNPLNKCEYHSCCAPHEWIEYCADLLAYLDEEGEEQDFAPEECDNFILEHHHEQLSYFGHPESYRTRVPATWRGLARIRGDEPDWFPCFAHDAKHRARWEEVCFAECEKYYTLDMDIGVLYATMQDMLGHRGECCKSSVELAGMDLDKAIRKLSDQGKLIDDLLQWAVNPCSSCLG